KGGGRKGEEREERGKERREGGKKKEGKEEERRRRKGAEAGRSATGRPEGRDIHETAESVPGPRRRVTRWDFSVTKRGN
ncbi:hypothetical protein ACC676_39670, partial [Rhizobium ruizarguesonis]